MSICCQIKTRIPGKPGILVLQNNSTILQFVVRKTVIPLHRLRRSVNTPAQVQSLLPPTGMLRESRLKSQADSGSYTITKQQEVNFRPAIVDA